VRAAAGAPACGPLTSLQRAGDVLGGDHVQELAQGLREPAAQPRECAEHGVHLDRSSQCTCARTSGVDERPDRFRRRLRPREQGLAPIIAYQAAAAPSARLRSAVPSFAVRGSRASLRHVVTVGPPEVDAVVVVEFC
jgi:hypothetical protein